MYVKTYHIYFVLGLKQWRDNKTLSEEEKMKLVQVYSKMIDVLLTQYKHQVHVFRYTGWSKIKFMM